MSLRFAILTALSERPGTGSQLARRFDRSFGYFWPASHQQIYRELARLEEAGQISVDDSADTSGPGQPKSFVIAPAGRAALVAWLGELDEPGPVRTPIAVRLRAAAATGELPAVRAALEHHLAERESMLATYQKIEERDFADTAGDPAAAIQHVVLRAGLMGERTWIEWCRDALAVLDDLSD